MATGQMLLTITTTHAPATELGYLLHKNPSRIQSFDLAFGQAHVVYPEVSEARCTAGLLLDIDPVGLVRRRQKSIGEGYGLTQYVNDRPYVASSFMSVAIAQVFSSALGGKCKDKPGLVDLPFPFEVGLPVLPCRGGEYFLKGLFEPLNYEVNASRLPLDDHFPEWGESHYFRTYLRGTQTLKALLSHLYVLIPVLDDDKHYWVTEDESEKLLRHGEGWLANHPLREQIVQRYLKHQSILVRATLAQLTAGEDAIDPDEVLETHEQEEMAIERKISLNECRLNQVVAELCQSGAKSILDLGCGEGRLLRELMRHKQFEKIVGLDVSYRALEKAKERLKVERLPERQKQRLEMLHGSLMYRDQRLHGYDAAAVVEVIEHLDEPRLAAFERVLFEFARPKTVVLTTPNAEHNVKFESLPAGNLRHKDHRFEWSRGQFESWARGISERYKYQVRFAPIGPDDAQVGPPTQMGVFDRED
jgi:3' terminal RNA ribose 2'-O-methyltransferase Hen1